METPPPFQPGPARKPKMPLWVWIAGSLVLICCGGATFGGFYIWGLAKEFAPTAGCAMTFMQASEALHMYAEKNDGYLPVADHWQDKVSAYFDTVFHEKSRDEGKAKEMLKMPEANDVWACSNNDGAMITGVAFNKDLSGKKLADIKDRKTPLVFEATQTGLNLALPYKKLNKDDAPKLRGKARDWFVLTVDGKFLSDSGKETTVNFGQAAGTIKIESTK